VTGRAEVWALAVVDVLHLWRQLWDLIKRGTRASVEL
jgi:hypothetical protein